MYMLNIYITSKIHKNNTTEILNTSLMPERHLTMF